MSGRTPSVAPALRVGFAGTPAFAAEALAQILAAGHPVPLVMSQPDRPAGRGLKLQPSPVKALALSRGCDVAQPRGLRLDGRWAEDAQAARAQLHQARLDVLVVAAYGLILPGWVLQMPRLGCVNIHASLLPRWRGAAPIHRAIEAGDAETGITLMQMDEGLDTGDMLSVQAEPIGPRECTATLHDRLAALGGRMVVDLLARLGAGDAPEPVRQPAQGITYAHKIDKAEAVLDWRRTAQELDRQIRAFDPFPGAHFQCRDDAVKLWSARPVAAPAGSPPGTVLAIGPELCRVACGEGALELLVLQRPGGRRGAVGAFLQARPLAIGERLPCPDHPHPAG